ncbi:hypothetical protein SDC9_06200 [bioreactor metagenome]|uniref:Stage II sporulation protein R n=1 Tax=bioreactor metagenome TaxID=1076179 RepID=A0A644T1H3_9ZZZZ
MRRKILKGLFISLSGCFVIIGWLLLAYNQEMGLSSVNAQASMIRFHVLANSDSIQDQEIKLKVRDAVIKYLSPHLKGVSDSSVARQIIFEKQDELIHVAQQVLEVNGVSYPVKLDIGIFDFPIKSYGKITLPAGKYEAVRILLGKAEGKNWWCILFPPLCFIDITNAAAVPAVAGDNKAVSQTNDIQFKWKIAEMWSGVKSN